MTFYVGQKVVCVDDDWDGNDRVDQYPQKDVVYTVNEIKCRGDWRGLILEEVCNRAYHDEVTGFGEPSFDVVAFRPAVSPKTSIKVFEEIRDCAVKGEPVDA